LGDGLRQGTLGGVGQDALRFVAIFPVGKVARLAQSAKGLALARVVADTGGPNCFWVASAKAFSQIGQKSGGKLLASVNDLAAALGMRMNALWEIPSLAEGMKFLTQLGAKVGAVKAVATAEDIARMIPFDGSVVMLAVRIMKNGQVIGGHAIYAFRNALGQVRYMDRTVGSVVEKVFVNVADIAPYYGASAIVPYEAAVLYNVFVKTFLHDVPRLVIPILGVIGTQEKR
jgi:hypothetical protein